MFLLIATVLLLPPTCHLHLQGVLLLIIHLHELGRNLMITFPWVYLFLSHLRVRTIAIKLDVDVGVDKVALREIYLL